MRQAFARFSAAPLLVSLIVPTLGAAQSIPSSYRYLEERQEVGLFTGLMSTGTGRFGYAPDGGTPMGLRYGVEMSGPLGFEGLASVVDGTRDVVDPGRAEGDRIIGQADSRIAIIDARIRFSLPGRRSWKRLSPFFVFGGGIAMDVSPDTELDDTLLAEDVFSFGNSFFGTLGVGTRWFVTDKVTLRADGIFSLWKVDTPPGYSDPDRGFEAVEEGEWLRGNSLQIALLYRW